VLELRKITKRFGRVTANDEVSIVVKPGTIHAVVGENGAGKSTAMRIAYGFYQPDGGEILIDGTPHRLASPKDAIALGVGMVHQHFMLVEPMTVAENVALGAEPLPAGFGRGLDWRRAEAEIARLAVEVGLRVDPRAKIADLSVGEQQRVELLKALYRKARLLILDEPTAVLAPQDTAELFRTLSRMREQGKTVVLITHKLAEVLEISDEVTVMRDGRVVGQVQTAETSAPELARMMVGRDVLLRVEKGARAVQTSKAPVLAVRDLVVRRPAVERSAERLSGVSFEVHAGEIVGVAGVEGNGQTELIEALAGLTAPTLVSGAIDLDGEDLTPLSAYARRALGLAHIPEDRHRRGLVLDFDLAENAILGVQDRPPVVSRPGATWMDLAAIRTATENLLAEFDVRPANPDLPARALSGGNQQKLVVGREMGQRPKLLLVAQPTRGVDIGAIEFIHRQLLALRDRGVAILLVSAELEEVTALSDRLLVLHAGKIAAEVDPAATTAAEIGLLMTGGAPRSPVGTGAEEGVGGAA
jgi:simple sugar transport system ATP-binding protein